ncbi:MAG: hypothetical protein AVDCRST_MAG69-732, partial [uncultured Solirubrobacteraceae bacterium]
FRHPAPDHRAPRSPPRARRPARRRHSRSAGRRGAGPAGRLRPGRDARLRAAPRRARGRVGRHRPGYRTRGGMAAPAGHPRHRALDGRVHGPARTGPPRPGAGRRPRLPQDRRPTDVRAAPHVRRRGRRARPPGALRALARPGRGVRDVGGASGPAAVYGAGPDAL